MLKREDPFTPQVRRGKKAKEYTTPLVKTPLRNMLSAENVAVNLPTESIAVENQQQQQRRRKALLSRTNNRSTDILSPAAALSPRAVPVTVSAQSNLLRSSPSISALNAQKLSVEQMTRSFEEWMRIAADNKINAKNTWNFALIDYFSELTFLRDGDNSINFQKASCTLDGCVKIYSSRVDAVVDETGRLLSGLNERAQEQEDNPEQSEEEEEEESKAGKKAKKQARPPGDTLEKNMDNLSLKGKLELLEGATIDPLFKKTCADFDEASGGTLLFNLTIDHEAKVIFDSNSAKIDTGAGEDASDVVFDAAVLLQHFGLGLSALSGKSLTSTTDNYSFLGLTENFNIHDRLAASLEKLSVLEPAEPPLEENPFGDPAAPPQPQPDYFDGYPEYQDEGADADASGGTIGGHAAEHYVEQVGNEDGPERFGFLSDKMKTTWAGAEHWKIKRVTRTAVAGASGAQQPRTKKLSEVDFASVEVDCEQLLAKGNNLSIVGASEVDTVLPDDLHIASAQFTRLFLKPAWKFSQVRAVVKKTNTGSYDDIQFIEQPLAIAEQDNVAGECGAVSDNDGYFDDQPGPVDMAQSILPIEQSTQAPPLQVSYTRRAKRIDIRLLKESIWRTISRPSPTAQNTLSNMIAQLPAQYSGSAERPDLSVQYAFICLLHLANENSLSIREMADGDLLIG